MKTLVGGTDKMIYDAVEAQYKSFGYEDIVQNNPHHTGTLLEHTIHVTDTLIEQYNMDGSEPVFSAAMFHDIGKIETTAKRTERIAWLR